jgi:ABC-2 type transport system permease protein
LKLLPVIFKRQLTSYACTPGTYLSIAIFLALSVIVGLHIGAGAEQNSSNLLAFFQFHPWLYFLLIPALATQLWSDESNAGFLSLIKTLPITRFEWVLGKFLAGWVVLGFTLMLMFPLVIRANYLGSTDNSVIASQFAASWLLAGSYLSASFFIFTLIRQRTIIVMLTIALLLIATGLSSVLEALQHQAPIWMIDSLATLNLFSRFSAIDDGKFALRDLLYFVSMILAFLAATIVTLNSKYS